MYKKISIGLLLALIFAPVWAQEGKSSFDYLLLPHSARAAALGGDNVSLIENDVSLIYNNPALLGTEMDKTLNASYLAYVADVGIGNVAFAKAAGERSAWGVGVQYAHYGNLKEMSEDNVFLGDLTAKDLCANVFYAHDLTEHIRGGISGKFFYSDYNHNTAIGLGVDLGLSYYNAEKGFSIGLAGKNIGRQIKAYEEELANLPWDIQLGLTKKLENAPIRFSLTGTWKQNCIVGIDILPSNNFWFGVGYNMKRADAMHLAEGNKFGGFSAGAGLSIKAFDVSCAVGKYNVSATSFMISVSTFLSEMKL
ncbi:MAG: type IX secretion system protein PorQ [Candidatus Symbiothrix sp.]|jgi:hypothetical protein|nr:type IX secretion system protein PorQ [Candidatus Symbiothrix sp.]